MPTLALNNSLNASYSPNQNIARRPHCSPLANPSPLPNSGNLATSGVTPDGAARVPPLSSNDVLVSNLFKSFEEYFGKRKKFKMSDCERLFGKNTLWDISYFKDLSKKLLHCVKSQKRNVNINASKKNNNDDDDKYTEFYRIIVTYFTTILLPTYQELTITSSNDLEEKSFYKNENSFYVLQRNEEGVVSRIKPPTPIFGPSKKYTSYDHIDFSTIMHTYPQTTVKIFEDDTLVVAKKLLKEENESSVCILSMTHPMRPGGDWKRGLYGQEESLFVRTTLSSRMDRSFYPLEHYDCVFVRDVTVIREDKERVYEFLQEKDRFSIDVVAMSGLMLDESGIKRMEPDQIDIVRKKVRSLLLACIENGVKNLVLGALGCGAFYNNPRTIAKIFKAELIVFAGFFNKVYFAIKDDDTCIQFNDIIIKNADGIRIYKPYVDWFHKYAVPTFKSFEPCEMGCMCTNNSAEHFKEKDHIPLCPDADTCKRVDSVHRLCFRHKEECPFKAFCKFFDDEEHRKYFKHGRGVICIDDASCAGTSPDDLSIRQHPPVNVSRRGDIRDRPRVVRRRKTCQEGTRCTMFSDMDHYTEYCHPFKEPCASDITGRSCEGKGEDHFKQHAHICKNGPGCDKIDDVEHCTYNIHAFYVCSNDNCVDLSETHLRTYLHPGQPVIREDCDDIEHCCNYERSHRLERAHMSKKAYSSGIMSANVRDLSLSKICFDYSKHHPFFTTNIYKLYSNLYNYISGEKRIDLGAIRKSSNFFKIWEWFVGLLPTHMCSGTVFKSILKLHSLNSLYKLSELWNLRKLLVEIALSSEVDFKFTKELRKRMIKYGKKYLHSVQYKKAIALITTIEAEKAELEKMSGMDPENQDVKKKLANYGVVLGILKSTADVSRETKEVMEGEKENLSKFLGEQITKFESVLLKLVDSVITLLINFPGIGDEKDKAVGTNKCVFGVLGPNTNTYGNSDCVIILKEDIMHHLDYFETPCAATFYTNGRYRYTKPSKHIENIWFDRRPWMTKVTHGWEGFSPKTEAQADIEFIRPSGSENRAKDTYFSEKYNHSDSMWEVVMPLEFILRTEVAMGESGHKRVDEITLEDIIDLWRKNNSHSMIEAHMPSSFSLDYIEHIILKEDLYNDLMSETPSDPEASEVFKKLVEIHGKGFIELTECCRCMNCGVGKKCRDCNEFDHKNVVDAEFAYFKRRAEQTRYRQRDFGYSFGLCTGGDIESEYFVPVSVENIASEKLRYADFTFAAIDGGFCFRLGNTGDVGAKESRDHYTFEIDALNRGLCCTDLSFKNMVQEPQFNNFCPKNDWIYYCVRVDYENSRITVAHSNPSFAYNKVTCSFECLREVTLASGEKVTEKKDIRGFIYPSFRLTSQKCRPFIRDFQTNFTYK